MEYEWIKLPLYTEWDFEYKVPVVSQEVVLRFYYEDRAQQWFFDASYATGEIITQGQALLSLTPMLDGGIEGVNGFLWLEPIQREINEVIAHPDMVSKYYNLYFIHWAD